MLEVQNQLTNVRGQIEQLSAAARGSRRPRGIRDADRDLQRADRGRRGRRGRLGAGQGRATRRRPAWSNILQALTTAGIWFAIVWLPMLLVLGAIIAIVVVGRPTAGPHRPATAARTRRCRDDPVTRAWHHARVTETANDTTGSPPATTAGGRRCWRRSAVALLDRLDGAVAAARERSWTSGSGPATCRSRPCGAGRRSVSPPSTPRARWSVRSRRWSKNVPPTARDRFEGRVGLRRGTAVRSGDVRRRDVVVRAPARAEPARGAPRDPARPAAGRDCSPTSPGSPTTGRSRPIASSIDCSTSTGSRMTRTQPPRRHPVRGACRRGAAPCRLP